VYTTYPADTSYYDNVFFYTWDKMQQIDEERPDTQLTWWEKLAALGDDFIPDYWRHYWNNFLKWLWSWTWDDIVNIPGPFTTLWKIGVNFYNNYKI
jgi:hypothetical protein